MKKRGGHGNRYSKKKESHPPQPPQKKRTNPVAPQKHSKSRHLVRLFFIEDRGAVRWYLLVILALGILGPGIVLIQIGMQNVYLRGLGILALLVVVVKVLPLETRRLSEKIKFLFLRLRQLIRRKPNQKTADNKSADTVANAAKVGQLLHLGAYETEIDALYRYVSQKGKVRIDDSARRFKVPQGVIQEWAKILEEHKLIAIHYPAFGSPVLKRYEEPPESREVESQ